MGIIWSIVIGAVAGFLAGKITKGSGFGFWINLIVGIVGGILGGWLFGVLGIGDSTSIIGCLITSVVGAVVLLFIISFFKKK